MAFKRRRDGSYRNESVGSFAEWKEKDLLFRRQDTSETYLIIAMDTDTKTPYPMGELAKQSNTKNRSYLRQEYYPSHRDGSLYYWALIRCTKDMTDYFVGVSDTMLDSKDRQDYVSTSRLGDCWQTNTQRVEQNIRRQAINAADKAVHDWNRKKEDIVASAILKGFDRSSTYIDDSILSELAGLADAAGMYLTSRTEAKAKPMWTKYHSNEFDLIEVRQTDNMLKVRFLLDADNWEDIVGKEPPSDLANAMLNKTPVDISLEFQTFSGGEVTPIEDLWVLKVGAYGPTRTYIVKGEWEAPKRTTYRCGTPTFI